MLVGWQADNIFYLDPHHPRLAIPMRSPPPAAEVAASDDDSGLHGMTAQKFYLARFDEARNKYMNKYSWNWRIK